MNSNDAEVCLKRSYDNLSKGEISIVDKKK